MTVVNDVKLKPKDGVFVPHFQKKKKEERQGSDNNV